MNCATGRAVYPVDPEIELTLQVRDVELVAELEQARRPWWQRLMTLTIDRPQRPTSRTSEHILGVVAGVIR